MTPQPEVSDAPAPEGELQLDVSNYVRALERKNGDLLRQVTVMEAVVEQVQAENTELKKALEEAMQQPQHNGRVTTPKPRKNTGKRTR